MADKTLLSLLLYCSTFLKVASSFKWEQYREVYLCLNNWTKQCKWDAEASRLKLLLFEVPQRWVQGKDADIQINVPLYSGPNICSFGFLFLFFFGLLFYFHSHFPFPFAHTTFSYPVPRISVLLCPYLLILQVFPPFPPLFLFCYLFPLISSLPIFLTILSISHAPAQFHLYP